MTWWPSLLAMVAYLTGHGTIRGAEHHPLQAVLAWLLMLPNLLTGPNVPNVTWTLSYEMVFYLLLAALFSWNVHRRSGAYATLRHRRGGAWRRAADGGAHPLGGHTGHGTLALNAIADALILAGIALAVSSRSGLTRAGSSVAGAHRARPRHGHQGSPSPWEGCMILALMFTGTLIYRTEQRQPGTSRAVTAAIVVGVLALATFAGLWHGQQRHLSHQWLIQWATSVLLAGATFGLGLAASHRRVPRWCAWLGMISFSVYLLHPLVFDAYRTVPALHRAHTAPVQVLMFAGCLAVIIGLSAVTYYLVERPMQRLGRRLGGPDGTGRGQPAAVAAVASGGAVDQAGQSGQTGQSADYATGAATGSGSPAAEAGSGRDTAPTARARRRPPAAPPAAAWWQAGPAPRRSGPRPPTGWCRAAGGAHAGVTGRAQRQPWQQGDAEAGRDEGLRRHEVVGGERDPGREPGVRALPEQVLAAAVAAGDPALAGQPGQVGRPQLGHRGRQRRFAAADRRVRHDQVHRLGQQHQLAQVVVVGQRRGASAASGSARAWGAGRRVPPSSASCRKISATSTYPARSIRSASGGSASVSRRSKPGCRSCRIAAAVGTMVPRAEGNAASRSRPARSPAKTTSSFSAASRRPMTSTARSASSRPASVSRMPRPARWTSLVPVSASSRARWWLTEGCA